jgi:hypothetical protein
MPRATALLGFLVMKKFGLSLLLALAPLSSFALSEIHSLSQDEQKAIAQFSSALSLSEDDALTVYKVAMQPHMKDKSWVYKFFDNGTLAKSHLADSPHRFLHMSLINDDRFVNYSFTRVRGTNQVLVYAVESLPRTSQLASKRDKELRADKKFEAVGGEKNFSMYKEKGKANVVSVFAGNGTGGIQYADHYFVDIKGD